MRLMVLAARGNAAAAVGGLYAQLDVGIAAEAAPTDACRLYEDLQARSQASNGVAGLIDAGILNGQILVGGFLWSGQFSLLSHCCWQVPHMRRTMPLIRESRFIRGSVRVATVRAVMVTVQWPIPLR